MHSVITIRLMLQMHWCIFTPLPEPQAVLLSQASLFVSLLLSNVLVCPKCSITIKIRTSPWGILLQWTGAVLRTVLVDLRQSTEQICQNRAFRKRETDEKTEQKLLETERLSEHVQTTDLSQYVCCDVSVFPIAQPRQMPLSTNFLCTLKLYHTLVTVTHSYAHVCFYIV